VKSLSFLAKEKIVSFEPETDPILGAFKQVKVPGFVPTSKYTVPAGFMMKDKQIITLKPEYAIKTELPYYFWKPVQKD
jgi:hypothetical protein